MKPLRFPLFPACLACLLGLSAGQAAEPAATDPATHRLQYKFQPGESIRWNVEHRAMIRTTIAGTTQTAETESLSVKVWQVRSVDEAGVATLEHSVESIRMRQRLSGRQEEIYDSTAGEPPPAAFEQVAHSVGIPLTIVRLDPQGKVLQRKDVGPQPGAQNSQLAVPLPEEPVAVGQTWSHPHEVEVTLEGGIVKKIQTRQQFTLQSIKSGVATLSIETVVLSPVREPAVEAQLIQRLAGGEVRFDLEAGRVLGQQMDLDKRVIGFQGETSSLHYQTRFVEELLPPQTAARPNPATSQN